MKRNIFKNLFAFYLKLIQLAQASSGAPAQADLTDSQSPCCRCENVLVFALA